jgi:hypothetical protein
MGVLIDLGQRFVTYQVSNSSSSSDYRASIVLSLLKSTKQVFFSCAPEGA